MDSDDIITHEQSLSEKHDAEEGLHIFHFDPHFSENEKMYEEVKLEILGGESSDEESSDDDDDEDDDEDDSGQDSEGTIW